MLSFGSFKLILIFLNTSKSKLPITPKKLTPDHEVTPLICMKLRHKAGITRHRKLEVFSFVCLSTTYFVKKSNEAASEKWGIRE